MIRIGLTTTAREVRISSSGDFYFMEKTPEASRQLAQGEILVRVEQEVEETTSVYQIQVASFARLENAEDLKKRLAETFDVPVAIHENSALGTSQVRVGEFSTREEAQAFLKTVVDAGYRDAFAVREVVATGGGKSTLALRGPKNLFRVSQSGFLFMPSSSTSFLRAEGKPYRGLFDIILTKSGRITLVNQLGMEEYLQGVVPAEINPTVYPEFAALAAQSVAARTYALKNMGKYRSDGFDLSDDTRTQVYSGVAGEKAATDEALRQTYGLAIYYQDKLIDAMYMSTCGGRTEDFSNVFDAPPVPYLKSVFCAIESGPEKGEIIVEGKHELEQVILADDGSVANRNLEFAGILGLMGSDSETSPEFFAGRIEQDEAFHWIENARRIAQRPTQAGDRASITDIATRAGFLQYAAESFFGIDEIKRRISVRDAEYYMGNLKDGSAVPSQARAALAYLMQSGLWRPYSDNTVRPVASMQRGDALSLLLRWVESSRPEILRRGTFMGAGPVKARSEGNPSINVKWGNKTQEFSLSQKLHLFRLDAGRATPVSSLRVIGNEKIAFHIGPSGTIDFLEIGLSPTGASSDRYSPAATWDVTMARAAIAEKLLSLTGNIGEFRDLKPARIGNSGRVVQIQAIGSRGSIVLNGYKVRNALGLRDTLFTLTREYNPDGSIANFTFYGRGWGHGVGLCQVGAFGMARAGRSYEEILKTYYQGVQIRKAY
jgi:stage II sporulation protein D